MPESALDAEWRVRRQQCLAYASAHGHDVAGYELVNLRTEARGYHFLYFLRRATPGEGLSRENHFACRLAAPGGEWLLLPEG